jgi:hypothetical protein|tara:strand:- start:608 stop:928 length:321 start_codon:yes stop_codon:yes gene_type:complete
MPLYTFRNKRTGEEWDDLMSISEMESFTKKRDIELVPTSVGIVSSVGQMDSKIDGGFKEVLGKISDAHPHSALADRYRKRDSKEAKSKAALDKIKRKYGASLVKPS